MTTAAAPSPVLSLHGITKRFGALVANDHIDLTVHAGEVVALLGENGAGKTTLMNILFGHYVADSGQVRVAPFDGTAQDDLVALPAGSPHAALDAGIGMVHQHFTLAENLTGFENIVLGTEPLWRVRLTQARARAKVQRIARDTGLAIDLDRIVARLSVGEKQRLEILKALYRDARILVLDEPTAVLTPQQAEGLFETVRALAAKGLAVIFISHKLAEVEAIADRVVVLRGGVKVADRPAGGLGRAEMAELMVGRKVAPPVRPAHVPGPVLLELVDVDAGADRDRLDGVSFALHRGEIVGIAGVSGNGQSKLAAVIGGLASIASGEMRLDGAPVVLDDPRAAISRGIGRIPEDRHGDGAVGALSVAENLALETVRRPPASRAGFLSRSAIHRRARAAIEAHDVRCPGPDAPIRLLSGGNMQKVVLARVLDESPRVILANQPTRGLDVAATAEVHRRLIAAREREAGVIVISEDLDELFFLCDRIAVMHRGHLSPALPVETLDVASVGLMMAGHAPEHDMAAQGDAR